MSCSCASSTHCPDHSTPSAARTRKTSAPRGSVSGVSGQVTFVGTAAIVRTHVFPKIGHRNFLFYILCKNVSANDGIYTHALPEARKAAVWRLAAQLFPDVPQLGPDAQNAYEQLL